MRRVGIGVLAVVVVAAGLLAAAFAVAQTTPAKDQISGYVADTLTTPQQQAEVEQLGGLLPFDVRIGRLALRDDRGAWLEVNDARVKLSPTALLRGEVHVEDAGARRVAINHLPPPAPEQPEPPSTEPFRLPELPHLPESLPLVRLDRLHLDTIELAEPVLGQPATFTLEGTGGTGDAGKVPQARLSLRRTDQPTAALDLDARLDLAARRLGIRLEGSETGGLVASATGQPQAGALRLLLEGDGPLDDWRGRLLADAERLARLETTLDLAYASTRRIRIDGSFTAAPGALPPGIAPVVGDRATLAVHAGETSPGVFALEQVLLQAGAINLTGTGTADLNADRLDGRAELRVPALAALSGLAGVPLAGDARLALSASGRLAEPALRLELDGNAITADRVALARLDGLFDATLVRSAEGTIAGARVSGGAEAEGLAVEGRQLGDGRGTLEVQAEVPPTGQVQVQRLALASGLARLDVNGAVDRQTLAGRVSLDAGVPDLTAVLALLPPETARGLPPVAGALALNGEATLGAQADRIDTRLTLTGERLAGLPPGAMELLGAAPRIEATALVEQKKAVTVQQLRLDGAGITVTGNPSLGLERQLGGRVTVELPDLARLEPVAKQPLGGRVAATADLGGTLDAPSLRLDASGEAVRLAGQTIDRLGLRGSLAGPPAAPAGDLTLTASRGGQDLALATDYAFEGGRLRLPRLDLTGPQTRLAGDLDLDLERTLASGRLAGAVGDLAALSAWHQQELSGAVELEAALATPGGRQDARLKATARGIAGGFGRLQQATLTAELRDALGEAAVDAEAAVSGFAQPELEVREASLAARGPLSGLDLRLAAAGTQAQQPFDLRAEAEVAALGERKSLLVRSLGGKLAGQRIDLMSPARLSLDRGVLDLDQLDLKVGPAQIEGRLRYGNGRAAGEIRLAALPLGLLSAFGAPALQGTAEGRLGLSATPRAPALALDVAVRRLKPGGAGPRTPGTDLDLASSLRDGRLDARLTAAGLGAQPLVAEASLPVRFSLEPFALAVPETAPLSGSITGTVDLARAALVAALDGQELAGALRADLRLAGTLAQPALDGALAIRDGRVDDVTTGASFRGLTLEARAQGRRLEIAELRAADRYGGRVAGKGSVGLDADLAPRMDLALNLARARVLDGDLGAAVISGDASLEGDGDGARVEARLTVNEADIRIPERGGGPSIPELDVAVKGAPPPKAPERAGPAYPVALDVRVDAPARLFIRGRGLESEWGGSVRAGGTAEEPDVRGQLRFRRGFLDLLDRRFAIREALIAFDGSRPPIPQVDLEAAATTEEVQAVVRVRGPATDPRLELTSEPPLPQDEVLARVLFGRSKDRITPVQGIRLAAALRELQGGGGGLNGVLDSIRNATGLDTLDIEGGATAAESAASAGKYLNDRVYLQVQRGIQSGSGRARVEVEITPNLSVGTSVTEQSQTGVDLQWRYDY